MESQPLLTKNYFMDKLFESLLILLGFFALFTLIPELLNGIFFYHHDCQTHYIIRLPIWNLVNVVIDLIYFTALIILYYLYRQRSNVFIYYIELLGFALYFITCIILCIIGYLQVFIYNNHCGDSFNRIIVGSAVICIFKTIFCILFVAIILYMYFNRHKYVIVDGSAIYNNRNNYGYNSYNDYNGH